MLVLNAPATVASDRALLIGIGHYGLLSPLPPVPGVDVDLAKMRQVVEVMGFAPADIRVLADEGATVNGIRASIRSWLIDGTRPGERALLYFSGHGSQVRDRTIQDEEDGLDEVLVGYDVRLDVVNGQLRASGVLTDDELFDLLDRLPDRNVLVLLDACSSASATRGSADSAVVPVGWTRKGATLEDPIADGSKQVPAGDAWMDRGRSQTWVSLSAAGDDQSAVATPYGSFFTQAVHDRLLDEREGRQRVSLTDLRENVADYIQDRSGRSLEVPEPVLQGPAALEGKGIRLVRPDGHGPVRRQLESLASVGGGTLLTASRRDYRYDDDIRLTVNVPQAGYLNVIAVDSNDRAYLLFPNRFNADNRVSAGTRLELGNALLGFELKAQEPNGETYVLALYTGIDRPLNFYREALAEYGEILGIDRGLAKLSTAATLYAKGIRVTAPAANYRAQGLTIQVEARR
jgi:hypothetical protein